MMKKLYERSELWFSIAWIIAYCVLASVGDNLSAEIGILKVVTLPILILLSALMFLFVKKNRLLKKYGLCGSEIAADKMLYYIPLLVISTVNIWHGFAINATPLETLLYVLSMFFVGFLEEMIFRGFLFQAIAQNGVETAIIVSSMTFGMGHMMNLINGSGAELLPSILQVIYAVVIGFAFVMVYYKTKSLFPCIVTHSIFNALSIFTNKADLTSQRRILTSASIILIAGAYAWYLASINKEKNT